MQIVNAFFGQMLALYRRTFKRLRPVHVGLHWLMRRGAIPLLESLNHFKTMPDDPFWFRLELLTQRHEVETLAQVRRLVRPGMTVLDVGAHVGYYARVCSQIVGASGRVIAFEPHPRTFGVLVENVRQRANVTPLQLAVAEAAGTAELYDYLMMSASGSLHYDESMLELQKSQLSNADIAPRIAQDFPVTRYEVRTVAVDDLLQEMGLPQVDVIKMDIEGAELGALRGLRGTIANSPGLALIMEFNPQALQAFGSEPVAALHEVLGLGFSRVQAIEHDGSLTDLTGQAAAIQARTQQLMDHMGVVNLLFTRG